MSLQDDEREAEAQLNAFWSQHRPLIIAGIGAVFLLALIVKACA